MTHDNRSFFARSFSTVGKIAALSAILMSAATDIQAHAARLAERHRQRRALARLDHRLLKDIGLSVDQTLEELRKPFWR